MDRALRRIVAVIAFVSMHASGAICAQPVQPALMDSDGSRRPRLTWALLDRFIVVPEHKLLFCYIEKVACMNFNELFKHVRAQYDPTQLEGNPWYKNTPVNHSLTKKDLENMLVDESWHKAVFWRNPLERFASAFKSKCEHADDDGDLNCMDEFGVMDLSFTSAIAYFAVKDGLAAEAGQRQSTDWMDNEHFRRMGSFCGGLEQTLVYYSTVEELTTATSHEKVSNLLRTVGIDPANVSMFDELFPPPMSTLQVKPISEDNVTETEAQHNTGVQSQMDELFPANQPWLMNAVEHHYRSDYELFKINTTALFRHTGVLKERWPLLDEVRQRDATRPSPLQRFWVRRDSLLGNEKAR